MGGKVCRPARLFADQLFSESLNGYGLTAHLLPMSTLPLVQRYALIDRRFHHKAVGENEPTMWTHPPQLDSRDRSAPEPSRLALLFIELPHLGSDLVIGHFVGGLDACDALA